MIRRLSIIVAALLLSCNTFAQNPVQADRVSPNTRQPLSPWNQGGMETGKYRNLLLEAGYSPTQIDQKLDEVFNDVFSGPNKVYFEVGDTMAYISDVKNNDVRTEGMSYGMMIAVQFDRKDIFDRLWRWCRKYMQMEDGPMRGYFRWSCKVDGTPNAQGPASDGELYYITSLLFASNRWGNDSGIDYLGAAQHILDAVQPRTIEVKINRDRQGNLLDKPIVMSRVVSLIDTTTNLITFVPGVPFTDPSYHLPAFYEVWARYAQDGRSSYWLECARASREYLHRSIDSKTGLNPDYNNFDGSLLHSGQIIGDAFRFDSWRVPMNIALDYSWSCADREWQQNYGHLIQNFLYSQGIDTFVDQYNVDGTRPERLLRAGDFPEALRHSIGLVATSAAVSLVCTHDKAYEFIDAFWKARHEPDSTGYFDAYYDGLLRLFAFMHLSGRYRVIEPSKPHVAWGSQPATRNEVTKLKIVEEGGTGPYKAVMQEVQSLEAHTLFLPTDLSAFGPDNPLPLLVWGNGACTNSPWEHFKFLNEIASHGYLVIATGYFPEEEEPYRGPMSSPEQQTQSINWAIAQNHDPHSPLYQKIDEHAICASGMSCGGLQTLYNCADTRITLLMICNSGLFIDPSIAMPNMPMPGKDQLLRIHTPVMYLLGGETDIAYANGMDDFHRINHVPAIAVNYPVGHGGTYRQPHGGEFSIPALAWLDWQLKGKTEARQMLFGQPCGLQQREGWTVETNQLFQQLSDQPAAYFQQSPNGRFSSVARDGKLSISYPGQDDILTIDADIISAISSGYGTEDYDMVMGKRSHCSNRYTEWKYLLSDGKIFVLRLYDDGIAWRQSGASTIGVSSARKGWLMKWSDAYEGFFECNPSQQAGDRWGYPALFEMSDTCYMLLSESDMTRQSAASSLYSTNSNGVFEIRPDGEEDGGWQVAIVGSLSDVVESTLITDVAAPCRLEDTSWIHPGVASWVYWAYNHGSNDYDIIKRYTDMAATLHLPYVLIDAEWDEMKNGKTMEDAVRYAVSKGVKPLIWYSSSIGWIDGAPGPKFRLNKPEDREREFAYIAGLGVAGVKIDFFSGDTNQNMAFMIDLLESAARHHLCVNFHGATIPRGWQRTYPNLLSTEAVYGAEWYNNRPTLTKRAAAHNATLPFTRNVIGSMDYTPCAFTDSQHPHITTHAHELALTALFESGIQHLADRPESFLAQPQEVKDYLGTLPTAWDETLLLAGYPAQSVVMARRKGTTWYVCGINGTDKKQNLTFSTARLQNLGTDITFFADGKPWKITHPANVPTSVLCHPRGGFIIVIK